MRYAKLLAAAFVAAALLAAGHGAIFPQRAWADQADETASPRISAEVSGEAEPAQSLRELLGLPAAKAGGVTVWSLTKDTVAPAPAYVSANEKIYLAGHTLTVYGDLTVQGVLVINGGKLIIRQNNSYSNTGNLIVKGGLLVMQSTADYVKTERSAVFDGKNETGYLSAGELEVCGHFLQLDDYSSYSYNETGTHSTVLSGANKLAVFKTPLSSGILNLTMKSATFTAADTDVPVLLSYNDDGETVLQRYTYHTTGGTFLCLRKLSGAFSAAVPNLYFVGAQNGCALNVPGGNLIVPQGATLTATGNISAGRVTVYGALTASAASVTAGGFYASAGDIQAEGDGGKTVTISKFTSADISIAGDSYQFSGDVGPRNLKAGGGMAIPAGEELKVGGTLTVLPGAALAVGAGRLFVSGGMDVKGLLDMRDESGVAVVLGAYTAEGGDSWGRLTNGLLVVRGDFTQKDSVSRKSFCAGAGHTTALLGGAEQQVSFESPAGPGDAKDDAADASWFGALVNCNAAYSPGALPAISETISGTRLSGFEASAGGETLSPYHDAKNELRYEIAVPVGADEVSLTPLPAAADETLAVSAGGSSVAAEADGSYTIPVDANGTSAVTVEVRSAAVDALYAGEGEPFRTSYTVVLQPQNPCLSDPGIAYPLDKPFDADADDAGSAYAVTVPARVESFTMAPAVANPNATLKIRVAGGASPAFPYRLAPGQSVEMDVTVTSYSNASSPAVTKTYRFTFRRQALLDGIDLSYAGDPGYTLGPIPGFSQGVYEYAVEVSAAVYAVTVTPTKGDGCATCVINNSVQNSIVLNPPAGGSARAVITLTESTGSFSKTYTLTVSRKPLLSGITVSYTTAAGETAAAVRPGFASTATGGYVTDVPLDCTSVKVTGAKAAGCLSLTVGRKLPGGGLGDNAADEYSFMLASGGEAEILLVASAGGLDQQKVTYTVKVRKHLLSGLGLSPSRPLTVPFDADPAVTSSVTIPYAWPSVTLLPTVNGGEGAVVFTFYAGANTSGTLLPGGVAAVEQGTTKTFCIKVVLGGVEELYKVNVTRQKSDDATLKSLGASAGWLSPAFSPATTSYTLTIPETVSAVTLKPVVNEPHSVYRIDTLKANTPRTISLSINGSAKARIVVTAANGNTKAYSVTVRRAPMLSSFSARPVYAGYASLSPGGTNRMKIYYVVTLPCTVKVEAKKGTRWYAVYTHAETAPGSKACYWDGKVSGAFLAAGTYSLRVTPYYAGRAGTARTMTVKILAKPVVTIPTLSPTTLLANGTNRIKTAVKWTKPTDVKVEVVNSRGTVVRSLYTATYQLPASVTLYWDGKDASGRLVPAGTYRIKATCGGASPVYKSVVVKR